MEINSFHLLIMIQKNSNLEAFEYGRSHLASSYKKLEEKYINNQEKIDKLKKKIEVTFLDKRKNN